MDQQRWIVKLMGFDYDILYRLGRENMAADALSRMYSDLNAISCPRHSWLEELHHEAHSHPKLVALKKTIACETTTTTKFTEKGGLLWHHNRLVIPTSSQYKTYVIRKFHDTPIGGHSGVLQTYERVAANFYWVGMKRDIRNYIKQCDVCQRNKHDTLSPAELLQPLPIPNRVWEDISLDFIERLPISNGFSVILVVVDRLTKYGHFITMKHPYTAKTVAATFLKEISRLHGMPRSIVSDRDKVFTSQFWTEYFRLQDSELQMSSAYHPQTDGQTEALNKCLETYLQCFVSSQQKQWNRWLHWAKYWYNTSYHTSAHMTPFEALYGRPPPFVHRYEYGSTVVAQMEGSLLECNDMLRVLKDNLVLAQNRMKTKADRHRREQEFGVDDLVFSKVATFLANVALQFPQDETLSMVLWTISGIGAYWACSLLLRLAVTFMSTPRFHVSQIKKKLGAADCVVEELPTATNDGTIRLEPKRLIDIRWVRHGGKTIQEALVQWTGLSPKDATWEGYAEL
jgi:hypothetical protein